MHKENALPPDTLVDEPSAQLLQAMSHTGPEAVAAYRRWRALVDFTDADFRLHRVLPLLADLVRREGLTDPELNRMHGVARHIWTRNTLNQRLLLTTLDALASEGIFALLLKGAALFARSATFMARRASGDADIMVRPEQLETVAAVLQRRGFVSPGHHWDDFGVPLIESASAGVNLELPPQIGDLDLHWRPLWNIADGALTEGVLERAETRELHARRVLVPSVTDQLFLSLARCEPWDETESFGRLVEARFLLSEHAAEVDWPELVRLVGRYGLEATARAFLGDLTRHAALDMPDEPLDRFAADMSGEKRAEWAIRSIPPERRSEQQRWTLQEMDSLFHRSQPRLALVTRREMEMRQLGLNRFTAGSLWQALRERVPAGPTNGIQFLEGFSSPESAGRWSTGRWSAIAVPLSAEQQAGEPVRFNAHAFLGRDGQARIVAHGGRETFDRMTVRGRAADFALSVHPLPELGDAGLILLWLPDARTPQSTGESNDRRELGLFIRREWQAKQPDE